jgi:Fringe-like
MLETFNMNFTNVRWFVMADDDTVLFIDNLVEVLQRWNPSIIRETYLTKLFFLLSFSDKFSVSKF